MSESIHPDTHLGHVSLTISNLDRSLDFYENVLRMQVHRREDRTAMLGGGGADILELIENPQAKRAHRTSGLYHFAILRPSRFELAQSLRRLAETRWRVQGFADHLVSEAIYLSDPDGNGIEIYRDRLRSEWPRLNGRIQMASDPIDLEGILAELEGQDEPWTGMESKTILGHMHLHVGELDKATAFYHDILGFDLITSYGGSAAFVSAGGYHHHIAFNTWAGVGVPPPPPDSIGLRYFVIRLPDTTELGKVVDRIRTAGLDLEEQDQGLLVRDPSQNGVILSVAD